MLKKLTLLTIVVLMNSSCSNTKKNSTLPVLQPTTAVPQNIFDYFPLRQGAYWVYQGTVKWTEMNSSEIQEEVLTWKMEVKRVFERNAVAGYEMLGAPWDLAWYERGKEPGGYGIIQAGGKFYKVQQEAVIRLLNEDDGLFGLVDENDILLETPLAAGKKFCDSMSMTRPDGMYCWNVYNAAPFSPEKIKGVFPSTDLWEFPIAGYTLPDASMFYFVPGIGFSRYRYSHHGTVSEVDVHLVEYYPGQ